MGCKSGINVRSVVFCKTVGPSIDTDTIFHLPTSISSSIRYLWSMIVYSVRMRNCIIVHWLSGWRFGVSARVSDRLCAYCITHTHTWSWFFVVTQHGKLKFSCTEIWCGISGDFIFKCGYYKYIWFRLYIYIHTTMWNICVYDVEV